MFGAGAHRTLLGLVLAVSLGTAGCADSDEPTTLPTLTPSPSESSSADASVSASPAKPASKRAEVEAAVRAFYEAANEAIKTGNTTSLRQSTTPECTCLRLAQSVERVFAEGRSRGADWKIISVEVTGITGRVAGAEVRYQSSAYEDLNERGEVLQRYPGADVTTFVALLRDRGSKWKVSGVDVLQREVRDA